MIDCSKFLHLTPYDPTFIHFTDRIIPHECFEKLAIEDNFLKDSSTCKVYKFKYPKSTGIFVAFKKLNQFQNNGQLKDFMREILITNDMEHPGTMGLLGFNLCLDNKNSNADKFVRSAFTVTKFFENGTLESAFGNLSFRDYSLPSKFKDFGGMSGDFDNFGNFNVNIRNGTIYTVNLYLLARSLAYLHQNNVIHRDLKPDNIYIDELGLFHIGDFGYSKQTESEYQSIIKGTPYFNAPEKFSSMQYQYSSPSDVYAMGLLFYSICEGHSYRPAICHTRKVTLRDLGRYICSSRFKIQFMLTPEPMRQIITKMCDRDPSERPTMEQVCEYLENMNNWLPNTDPEVFEAIKKWIDTFEEARKPLMKQRDRTFENSKTLGDILSQNQINVDSYRPYRAILQESRLSNPEANYALGLLFTSGMNFIPKDYVLAWKYLMTAEKLGDKKAGSLITSILNEIIQKEREYRFIHKHPVDTIPSPGTVNITDPFFNQLTSPEALLLVGMIHEASKEIQKAIHFYCVSAKNGCFEAYGRLGELLVKTHSLPDKSEKSLKVCIEKSRNEDEKNLASFYLAILKHRNGDFDGACKDLQMLYLKRFPDAASLLAAFYYNVQDFEKAKLFYSISRCEFNDQAAAENIKILNDHVLNL